MQFSPSSSLFIPHQIHMKYKLKMTPEEVINQAVAAVKHLKVYAPLHRIHSLQFYTKKLVSRKCSSQPLFILST